MASPADKAAAEALKAAGNAAFTAKDYAEAADLFGQAIALDGSNHVYFSNRSGAYLALGRADDAVADAEACLRVDPTWVKGFSRLGAALHAAARYPEAAAAYARGLRADPANAALHEALVAVQQAAPAPAGESGPCFVCGEGSTQLCAACQGAWFCTADCQRAAWKALSHGKAACAAMSEAKKRAAAAVDKPEAPEGSPIRFELSGPGLQGVNGPAFAAALANVINAAAPVDPTSTLRMRLLAGELTADEARALLASGADPVGMGACDMMAQVAISKGAVERLRARGVSLSTEQIGQLAYLSQNTHSLGLAADLGNAEVLAVLLTAPGIDVDASCVEDKNTALHLAICNRHKDCAQLLLDAGANPELRTEDGKDARALARALDAEDRLSDPPAGKASGALLLKLLSRYQRA